MWSNRQRLIIAFIFLSTLIINWQLFKRKTPTTYHDEFIAFGTVIDVSLPGLEPTIAKQVDQQIQQSFNKMNNQWHAWHRSDLTVFNQQLKTKMITPIPVTLQPLIVTAQTLAIQSQHLFNPALGSLIELWGFHQDAMPQSKPKLSEIQALQPFPTLQDLHINHMQAQTSHPHLQLDFGAFAKGYALDKIIQQLQQQGIHNALINAGGDLKAIGKNGHRAWRIGIRHPRQNAVMASIEILGEESVLTSGDYERYFKIGQQRFHHLLSPHTGYPATHLISVTTLHQNAARADAAATALFVAEPQQWATIAKRMHIDLFMLVDPQQTLYLSPAMSQRITLLSDFKTIKIIHPTGTFTDWQQSTH